MCPIKTWYIENKNTQSQGNVCLEIITVKSTWVDLYKLTTYIAVNNTPVRKASLI